MSRIPSNAGNMWPGMTEDTALEFTRIGQGLPIANPNKYAQVHVRYYHQIAIPATGASNPTQFSFFNAAAQEHVTNLNMGQAPDERPFWLTGICFTVQDLTAAGVNGALGYTLAATYLPHLDYVRAILQAGLFQLNVGDRKILEVQDLTHFPSDGGFSPNVVGGTTTAGQIAAQAQNGQSIAGNRFRLPAPYPILPGKQISAFVKYQSIVQSAGGLAFRLKCELVGESVLPLNA